MKVVRDWRDHAIAIALVAVLTIATVYLFKFHSDMTFGGWVTLVGTLVPLFHWLSIFDDKRPDAGDK
jgi:hypothetical protein